MDYAWWYFPRVLKLIRTIWYLFSFNCIEKLDVKIIYCNLLLSFCSIFHENLKVEKFTRLISMKPLIKRWNFCFALKFLIIEISIIMNEVLINYDISFVFQRLRITTLSMRITTLTGFISANISANSKYHTLKSHSSKL